jgi:hypothetical protein
MAHMTCIRATNKPVGSICTACNGSSSAAAAAAVAAARLAPAGYISSSSGSSSRNLPRVSGYVGDLLTLLQPEVVLGVGEEALLPVLQDLEDQQLLPSREVRLSSANTGSGFKVYVEAGDAAKLAALRHVGCVG